ncbi:PDDEXK nuclease domain-containing protein [Desulfovibrio cuneatus]|uniref:PDDEXK nuclease domain-containing protein n=1 Tax=Desulfovibrio cuneatus TaxID=159728 RepID=UPI0003FBA224|nr:PDDEXK nuclease domain-containing protein [Desulfovibrio cuneatus]
MNYPLLLKEIKDRIRQAQVRAALSANAEMLFMYWDVGRIIAERRSVEGWGTKIIQRLAQDIRNDLPETKGFSERNLKRMLAFHNEYRALSIMPTALAQLPIHASTPIRPTALAQFSPADTSNPDAQILQFVLLLPWAHNATLLGVKETSTRLWYMAQTLEHGWSHDFLVSQIKSNAHERLGKATTNFSTHLPTPQSALAQEVLKDPYLFDFLTLEEPFHERELETGLVGHVEKFLLELGAGFAFMGRQYHVAVNSQDFYIDLLFYHTKLHCYVVIELKKGKFKPEYAGKVNFYCSVVDDVLRDEQDNPTIGLILCQTNDRIVAEYTLRNVTTPIGVSEYELTRALPEAFKSSLPTVEEIEERLEEGAE